jgi:hypothetical protein
MMRNTRLSYNALASVVEKAKHNDFTCEELKKYLATGALNESQLNLLIDAVSTNQGSGDFPMLGVLMNYVKRYSLRKEHWQRIRAQYPKPFIELLEEAARTVEQARIVRSLKNTPEGHRTWEKFCQETEEILPLTQGKMALWQYKIFHNTGHKLDDDAIRSLLHCSDEKLWRLIFEWEKIENPVDFDISSNVNWWPVYQEVMKARKG